MITYIDNNKKLYKKSITTMFNSAPCSRQFHRYDLEYIRLLSAVKKVAASKFYV